MNTGTHPISHTRSLLFAVTATLMIWGALCVLTVQGAIAGFNWDDAIYLLMADAYSGRLDGLPTIYQEVFSWRDYPPLYPLFLALFGGGSDRIDLAFVANALTVALSVLSVYGYGRVILRDRLLALSAAATFLLSDITFRQAFALWSENLFISLAIGALAISHSKRQYAGVAAAIMFGAAALTRTAGVAWCAAFAIWVLVTRPRSYRMAAVIAFIVPTLERAIHSGAAYRSHVEAHTLSSASLGELGQMTAALASGLARNFSEIPVIAWVLALLFVSLTLYSIRRRQLSLECTVVLFYLGELMLWGFPEQASRFVYPLLPIAIVLGLAGLVDFLTDKQSRRPLELTRVIGLLTLLAVACPPLLHIGSRWRINSPDINGTLRRTSAFVFGEPQDIAVNSALFRRQMTLDAKKIRDYVPVSECVVTEFPPLILLHAKRVAKLPPWHNWSEIRSLKESPCRFYYALPAYVDNSDPVALERLGAKMNFQSKGFDLERPADATGIFLDLTYAIARQSRRERMNQ